MAVGVRIVRCRGGRSAKVVATLVAAAWLLLPAQPAVAACHIAAFVETDVEGSESTGVVSLVVELQGRVGSCAGTVDVATVDGEAVAGEDYEAVTRTLTFEADDDRVETVDVTLLADDDDDGGETFTVELSNPTGSISGTGDPATVTISDGGGGEASEAPGSGAGDPTEEASEPAAVDGDQTGVEEDDGLDIGILLAVIGALAVGIAAVVLLRGRGR